MENLDFSKMLYEYLIAFPLHLIKFKWICFRLQYKKTQEYWYIIK